MTELFVRDLGMTYRPRVSPWAVFDPGSLRRKVGRVASHRGTGDSRLGLLKPQDSSFILVTL